MAPYLIIILILIGLLGFNNPIPITILVVIFGILPIAKSGPTKLSHIDLQTRRTNCECGGKLNPKKRLTEMTIYTWSGTMKGFHHEFRFVCKMDHYETLATTIRCRCAVKHCQRGYYHGYSTYQTKEFSRGIKYWYDDDCLGNLYLVTSQQTWWVYKVFT